MQHPQRAAAEIEHVTDSGAPPGPAPDAPAGSEVRSPRAEKAQLEKRLAQAGTTDQLVREARRLGLVKPGERLFIVKNIAGWRKNH